MVNIIKTFRPAYKREGPLRLFLFFCSLFAISTALPSTGLAASSLSQFGITWTFDKDYTAGQFANGDYWVVGPVTIIGINPASTEVSGRTKNGSMLNPSPTNGTQGYDSAMAANAYASSYNAALDVSLQNPLVLNPSSSLVSTISIDKAGVRPQIKTAAILTILDNPAPVGSFRPSYSGTDKTIRFNKNDLDYSLLSKLQPVGGTPALGTVERYFERPWIDHKRGWSGRYQHPAHNMPDYGRDLSSRIGVGALILHLDFTDPQKETLLIRFVQLGIDLYGIVEAGGRWNWANNGGHASGRKWPILFTGLVLNDPDMKNIGRTDLPDYGTSHQDYVHFGEDDQTFYVGDDDIYEPPYEKHVWRDGFVYYGHGKGDKHRDYLEYTEEHWGMPEWGIVHATDRNQDGLDWNASYRRCCTANAWAGFVLAVHITGVKELWNHDALFDYMDRYMGLETQGTWQRQWSRFAETMWDTYRANYGYVWPFDPNAPVLDSIGNKWVDENSALIFDVNATDPNGDVVTYSAQSLPSGATFSGQTFNWTPSYDQAGSYWVRFIASDGTAQDSETITITVNNVNRPPVIGTITDQSVDENALLSFSVNATDPDGQTLTYSVSGLPNGAAFVSQTLTWTPSYDQAGTFPVTFTANDGQAQDSQPMTITVINVNRAPVFTAMEDIEPAYANAPLHFTIEDAIDPDGDMVTYSAGALPTGATFTEQDFDWTPSQGQAGSYDVTFFASDGQLQDSQAVTITVDIDNLAPTVTNCSPTDESIQVSLDNLIILHITDAGAGVDADSVTIKVDNNVVYTGDTNHYSSPDGDFRRLGNKVDYTFVYQTNEVFDYDQTVPITVTASDRSGNTMNEYSYYIVTEMYSFGRNKQVNSGPDNLNSDRPVTVRDSSGNIWAAWHAGPIDNRDIYVSKLAAGADYFDSIVQLTNNAADQCNPVIALDSSDTLYVVWQDNEQGNWDIYLSTSVDGISWSAETMVNDPNDANQVNPAIVIDGQSHAHVVWQDDRAGNQDIYVAASNDGFAAKTQITSDSYDQVEPVVTAGSDSTIYVVWTDGRNGPNDIYGAASNNNWANVAIVSNTNNRSSPAIAAESTGSILHLLWVDDTSGDNDIYYASSNGFLDCPLAGSSIIDDTSGADQLEPTIAVAGSTGNNLKVFACWQDWRNVDNTNTDTDLYFVKLSSGSGTNVFVGDGGSSAYQGEPAIGIDEYGHPYLVWTDNRSTNTDTYYVGSTFVEPVKLATELVSASTGATVGLKSGELINAGDISVIVPPRAYPCDIRVEASRIRNAQRFAAGQSKIPYELGPSGIEFSVPITITIAYEPLASGNPVSVYWLEPLTGMLRQDGIRNVTIIERSPTVHLVRFQTTHFTPFYLLGGAGVLGGGGGCSVSAGGEGNIVEFFLPYIAFVVVLAIRTVRDARERKTRNMTAGKC